MSSQAVTPSLGGSPFQLSLVGTLLAFVVYVVGSYLNSPLRRYPGPFLATGFTNLWRMYHIYQGSFHKVVDGLHKQYGPIVQIGPNVLDVDDPDLIKTVFNVKGDWKKTEAYLASSVMVEGHIIYNLFSKLDKAQHAAEKKPIAKYYSAAGVTSLEPHMDRTITQLCAEMEMRFVNASTPLDLGRWILYYTWDVVGAVTFSQPLGYLAAGRDFDGTLGNAEKAIDYFALLTAVPALDHVFDKNRWFRLGPPGFGGVTGMAIQRLVDRYQSKDTAAHDAAVPDFLDKFIEAKAAFPDSVNDNQIVAWLMINMIAGADTTAITIRSALYYSLRTPGVWPRLRRELAAAGLSKADTPISYKDARAVPYLDAVVREGLRYLPAVSLGLERYVPAGGQRLADGGVAPEKTILSFNPYILCRSREAWGPDADEFRPERWLQAGGEADDAFRDRLQGMNNADLSFGAGSRVCLGKHMGLMQVYKVVATLAVLYDVELTHPEKEWTVINSFFPRQEGLDVKMSKRKD
ncbi:cytochrome P450 [Lasiosphaeris hirsuta]|uniref:Cytochrome P450 n=1 Tax=Lasiosphaeris hirsuta TaxID=260670 RepID=A0AA40DQ12_9PEZI|nr:cytochrome P450 [Lasiosphaeris hirsuta]